MRVLILLSLLSVGFLSNAQMTINHNDNCLEISTNFQTYYNYRFKENTSSTNYKKNRFRIEDAVFQLSYRKGKIFEAALSADIADIAAGVVAEEDAPLSDAWIKYNSPIGISIKAGYQKIPYSRVAMTPRRYLAFSQRAEFARGDVFSIRDAGVTLEKGFLDDRIVLYAGAYTGLGEMSLKGDNDASGKLEYVSRVEFNYPCKVKYRAVDLVHTPTPLVSVGVAGRYNDKSTTTGVDYQIKTIDGIKTNMTADMLFQFRGFSFLYEYHYMRLKPRDKQGLNDFPTNHFNAKAFQAEANYFIKPIKTIIGIRYDELNPNDLVMTDTQPTMAFSCNYLINQFATCIKFQYWKRLKADNQAVPILDDQMRLSFQYIF